MRRSLRLLVAAGLVLAACRDRPVAPVPLPQAFAVRTLSGERLGTEQMRGTPWVVNFWLPT